MIEPDDAYFGRFTALLPTGPLPPLEQPAEEVPGKAREPRTRFSCLLPSLPPEGVEVLGNGRGRRRKAAEPPDPPAPENTAEMGRVAARG